jgi:hypothetical protein
MIKEFQVPVPQIIFINPKNYTKKMQKFAMENYSGKMRLDKIVLTGRLYHLYGKHIKNPFFAAYI